MTDTSHVPVKIIRETEKAYLLENVETKESAFFPKSQIHFDRMNHKTMEGVCVIPDWLLDAKGW